MVPPEQMAQHSDMVSQISYRRTSRRGFIGALAFNSALTLWGGYIIRNSILSLAKDEYVKKSIDQEVNEDLDVLFPATASNASLAQNEKDFTALVQESASPKDTDVVSTLDLNAQDITDKHLGYIEQLDQRDRLKPQEQKAVEQSLGKSYPSGAYLIGDSFGDGLGLYVLYRGIKSLRDAIKARITGDKKNIVGSTPYTELLHPQFQGYAPDDNEVLERYVSYLPPMGGKIVSVGEDTRWLYLSPTKTAEEQIGVVNGMRDQGWLDDFYVHQMTVQGRLPDSFKFAAIALLLDSPYSHDWNSPFYDAPWGKTAPLIHDGGRYDTSINKNWVGVKGRTDFIYRINVIKEPNWKQIVELDPESKSEVPRQKLMNAIHEQQERERLYVHAKAYQMLALCLHAREGNTPDVIPAALKTRLTGHWQEFENWMVDLLNEIGMPELVDIRWFREHSRRIWENFPNRYEADWKPIQQELLLLEEVKDEDPKLPGRVRRYLKDVTLSIESDLKQDYRIRGMENII